MKNFAAVLTMIGKHQKFLVTTHQNPDADALCAALAMAIFLKSLGKKVHVFNEDACPAWLEFLPKTPWLKKAKDVKGIDYEAAIVLDCGDLKRVGRVGRWVGKGKPLVNIDHHVTNDRFGTLNVVDAKASSTCEIIFDFLKSAGHKLNRDLALLLYAGIMTDTGSFRYDNTSARTHDVVKELMAYRILAPDMYAHLYVGIPVGDMKLFIELIHKADLFFNNRIYCVCLPKKVMARFSKGFDLKEKLFAFLRSVEGIEVVVILTELSSREVRVNLRSQGDFDVAHLALQFDGGGHTKAAGCKIYDRLAKAKIMICSAIKKGL